MNKILFFIFITSLSFVSLNANLIKKLKFGVVNTSGNTRNLTLNAGFGFSNKESEDIKTLFKVDVLYSQNRDTKTNERYKVKFDKSHNIIEKIISYSEINYLQNKFQGYRHQYSIGLGVQRELFEFLNNLVKARIGLIYREDDLINQEKKEFLYTAVKLKYKHKFNKNRFKSEIELLQNSDDTRDFETNLDIGFTFFVVGNLSFKTGFEMTFDNLPPLGKIKKIDTMTKMEFVYKF